MNNKITDLNNFLFSQMERLNEEDISQEELEKEIERSKAMASIAGQIIEIGKLAFGVMKTNQEYGQDMSTPEMLEMR